jgi:hypothetical protein
MVTPASVPDGRSDLGPGGNIRHAFQALALVTGVVVVDLALYALTASLGRYGYLPNDSIFPPLVLFMLFALSVGIILIVALGEKIARNATKNKWTAKFGVTPIMVIVSTMIGIFLSTSLLANSILPASPNTNPPSFVLPKFMLANLGIRCSSKSQKDPPEATGLLTFITSQDRSYIRDVRDFLNKLKKENGQSFGYEFISGPTDEYYQLLLSYSQGKAINSRDISVSLGDSEDNWVAYTADVKQPNVATSVPVPTMYDKQHESHLFVITTVATSKSEHPELDLINHSGPINGGSRKGTELAKKNLVPLFRVGISPKLESGKPEVDTVNFEIFPDPDQICWTKPLG